MYESCLLLLVAWFSLIDNLLHSCQLEGSFYECLWHADKGPWYKNISTAYHHWHELWHCIYSFFQSGEASMVKGNKHTHRTALPCLVPYIIGNLAKGWISKILLQENKATSLFFKKLKFLTHWYAKMDNFGQIMAQNYASLYLRVQL